MSSNEYSFEGISGWFGTPVLQIKAECTWRKIPQGAWGLSKKSLTLWLNYKGWELVEDKVRRINSDNQEMFKLKSSKESSD